MEHVNGSEVREPFLLENLSVPARGDAVPHGYMQTEWAGLV